jgi:predicted RNA-binding protein with PUA-like domain
MARWLVKSEPFKYSWEQLNKDGQTVWDGVRNNQAAIYLRTMKIGDELFFYHPKGRFPAVLVGPKAPLPRPVTLAQMKAEARLAGMAMFRQFRLSVVPITDEEWDVVMEMGSR